MSRTIKKVDFTDYVISQGDSDDPPERHGVLELLHTSDCAMWTVNGGTPTYFTMPELAALVRAYTGEVKR